MTDSERAIAESPGASWSDRWLAFRNGLLKNPRFQRWAAAFWLTRPIARRRASALFDLTAGFVYSQVLYAGVRLRLFEILEDGPMSVEDLATAMRLSDDAARRLLDAAASLNLTERCGPDRFGLGIHGASLLGNPSVAHMIEHHAMLYRDLADPIALLRGEHERTAIGSFWRYDKNTTDSDVAGYSRLMASSQALIAEDIVEAYPFDRHQRLLDVGGGEGAFVSAVARAQPELDLALFDLPAVAERARVCIDEAGLASRVEVTGGDLFADALPGGADIVSLVRIVHDHDDDAALAILRSVRAALPPGGTILIAEPMSNTPGAEAMGDAYFGLYLLAMGQGRPRSFERLAEMCSASGFTDLRKIRTRRPMLTRVLVGRCR